ncbi:MAG TPA: hypothetical protein VFX70_11805, partial [Mycobacteriales bacterium]|nr:hypothetical protein [Mycobacteriales bacterium]
SGHLAIARARAERIKTRLTAAGVSAGAGTGGGVAVWELAPHGVAYAGLAAVVAALGVAGRRADRPLVAHAVIPQAVRKLTPDVVSHAFIAAKLATDKDRVTFAEPISRDGAGFRVVVDLPPGQTADRAISRRVEISSGLDRDERQVFLSRQRGGTGSARRVVMWVADVDPLSVPAGRSPLVTTARVNFWQPFGFGVNERGATVPLCLMWTAMLVGAIPRMGKTFSARLPALAAALDPDVRMYVYDFKGSPDWVPFRHVAHRIQFGDRPDPDTGVDPVAEFLADMQELQVEVDRRYRTLRNLPPSVTPEGKLTEAIARSTRYGMPVVLVVADEIQRALGHGTYGKEIYEVLTDLVKAAPAVGVHFLASTQKPDKDSMPSGFRDQFGIRFALRVMSRDVSEVVLGAGAYSEGLNAATLSADAKGVGLLRGTGDSGDEVASSVVRTYLADGRDAETICQRGRALRDAAGTLTGAAIGDAPVAERHERNIRDDLAEAIGVDERAHSDVLCARLAQAYPDTYTGWTPVQLAAALKPAGIETRQVWATGMDGQPANRRGIRRSDLDEPTR